MNLLERAGRGPCTFVLSTIETYSPDPSSPPPVSSASPQPSSAPYTAYQSDPALVEAVAAAANCSPDYDPQMPESDVAAAVGAMNLQSCEYSKTDTTTAGVILSPYAVGGAAGRSTSQSSAGCEQVNVVSNMMNQCNQQLVCMINNASSNSTANVIVNQTIKIKAGDITDSTLFISNKSTVTVTLVNLLQQTTQSAIAATIQQGIDTTTQQVQSQSNEAFSDPNAQKQVLDLATNISNVASSTNIQQSVANTVAQIYSNQIIEIEVNDIVRSDLELSNESAIELIAKTFVYNSLSQILNTETVQQSIATTDQSASQENEGTSSGLFSFSSPAGIFLTIFVVLLLIGLGVGLYKKLLAKKS